MSWRSRWVIVPALLVLIVAGWNAYVAAHDGGVVAGRVIDAQGRPVAGAAVVLYARTFLTNDERARTQTGADGAFRFTGNQDHALQLQAEAGGAKSARRVVRLLFRAEDVDVPPLMLNP